MASKCFTYRGEEMNSVTVTDAQRGTVVVDLEPSSMNSIIYW